MTEYIKREAAINSLLGWAAQLTETYGKNDEYVKCLESAAYNIEQIPAADVRPVVHCRDCYWWTKQEASMQGRCSCLGMYPTGNWYCANGQKRGRKADGS